VADAYQSPEEEALHAGAGTAVGDPNSQRVDVSAQVHSQGVCSVISSWDEAAASYSCFLFFVVAIHYCYVSDWPSAAWTDSLDA
jgi:hypothetical protein